MCVVPRPVLWPIFLPSVPQSTFPSFSLPILHTERLVSQSLGDWGVGEVGEADGAAVVRATFLEEVTPSCALKDG